MAATIFTSFISSPVGYISITGSTAGIHTVAFADEPGTGDTELPLPITTCIRQLTEYFNGTRQKFELLLLPFGTPFQQQVWEHLKTIPFGKTLSYRDVAKAASGGKAIRAVGAANGRNPLCVVIPCHRVIGSDGSLTGYSGGLWRKEWLLRHEGILKTQQQLTIF